MAASGRSGPLLRSLLRELRLSNPAPPVRDHMAYRYVVDQFRRYELTTKKYCREQDEVEHMARTYLCYLESKRKYDDLHQKYKGGERSIEESARLVGLSLPETHKD